MTLPTLTSYGRGTDGHYADFGNARVWFSYRTMIAFQVDGNARVVIENQWSTTTANHLHAIDGGDKTSRVDAETFERLWHEQASPSRLAVA